MYTIYNIIKTYIIFIMSELNSVCKSIAHDIFYDGTSVGEQFTAEFKKSMHISDETTFMFNSSIKTNDIIFNCVINDTVNNNIITYKLEVSKGEVNVIKDILQTEDSKKFIRNLLFKGETHCISVVSFENTLKNQTITKIKLIGKWKHYNIVYMYDRTYNEYTLYINC